MDWTPEKLKVVAAGAVLSVFATCFTIGATVDSNNRRAIKEAELRESARKSKAQDDLEASRVLAGKEIREAEIKSKKRKMWERDAEGVPEENF